MLSRWENIWIPSSFPSLLWSYTCFYKVYQTHNWNILFAANWKTKIEHIFHRSCKKNELYFWAVNCYQYVLASDDKLWNCEYPLLSLFDQVEQDIPAKRSRIDCKADGDLITSSPQTRGLSNKSVARVSRKSPNKGKAERLKRALGDGCFLQLSPWTSCSPQTQWHAPVSPLNPTVNWKALRPRAARRAPPCWGPSSLRSSTSSHQQQKLVNSNKINWDVLAWQLSDIVSLDRKPLCLCPATPGSDSPGQAMEAEEIIKQLDMEPAEEMPSSTLTSADGIAPCHTAAVLPQRLQVTTDTTIEEGEIVTEADMPPLTGAIVWTPDFLIWLKKMIKLSNLGVQFPIFFSLGLSCYNWSLKILSFSPRQFQAAYRTSATRTRYLQFLQKPLTMRTGKSLIREFLVKTLCLAENQD